MNTRSTALTLLALIVAVAAAPNASPIDAGLAEVIAVNNNLGCSRGACNTTVFEKNGTSSGAMGGSYSSGAWARQDTWSSFSILAAGGLAFSTGLL